MKKGFRFAISRVLSLTLLAMMCISASATSTDATESIVEEYAKTIESVQTEMESNTTAERRAAETASTIQAAQIKRAVGAESWYAGQYIDNSGRLHVVVTDIEKGTEDVSKAGMLSSESIARIDNNAVKVSPSISIEQGQFSLNELKSIMTLIVEANSEYVYGCGIDEENNSVFVELSVCDNETIEIFKNTVIDSPAVTFLQSPGKALPMTTLYAGSVVWPTSSSRVTISTFGYKNDEFGFVTVGHTLGNTIKSSSSGSTLGTTSSSNKVMSSTADGSWTKLNSGHTGKDGVAKIGSTRTNYAYFESGSYDPVQGSSVSAYLGRSSSIASGTIQSVNYYYVCAYSAINPSWSDIGCYDIRVSGFDILGGDSASPMLGYASGIGTVIWGSLRSGSNGYANFCNIKTVVNTLGVRCSLG